MVADMKGKLFLAAGSTLSVIIFLLVAEGVVRLSMPHMKLFVTDRSLMRESVFGKTFGYQPDATGVSFSAKVRINHEGFRDLGGPAKADTSLLLIGDSVTFGIGVEEDSTFAGMVQQAHPSLKVINSAAIAYTLENYHDVVDTMLQRAPTIHRALIFYSLNDFMRNISMMQEPPSLMNIREFFRAHSKLYLWFKGTFFDRSRDNFLYDYEFYAKPSPDLPNILDLLGTLVQKIRSKGIECTVVTIPYEYQLRQNEERYLLPQKILDEYLTQHNIPFTDALEDFKNAGGSSRDYFLYDDPMHLSVLGHKVVFKVLNEKILKSSAAHN